MPRGSKPELCIFNVTIACLCLQHKHSLRKDWNADIKNKLSNLLPKISNRPTIIIFSYVVKGLGRCLRRVHQTQVWGALKKVQEPLLQPFQLKRLKLFFIHGRLNNKIQSTGKKFQFSFILDTCALSSKEIKNYL